MSLKPLLLAAVLVLLSGSPAPAADPPPSLITISGDVVDVDGKPVAGAAVTIPGDSRGGVFLSLASTITDASGKFVLANVDVSKYTGRNELCAFVPGVGISRPVSVSSSPAHLQLMPAYGVQLTMLQTDGSPATGVEMHLTFFFIPRDGEVIGTSIFLPDENARAFTATTDDSGKCILHGMPRNATLRFETGDPRYARLDYAGNMALTGNGPLIAAKPVHLEKGVTLSGRLLTSEGQPESGRELMAVSVDPRAPARSIGTAITDAAGAYTIRQLSPATFVVSLYERKDGPTAWVAPEADVTISPGNSATLNFTLTHGGFLKGQARDSLTGKPLEGLTIGLYADNPHKQNFMYYGRPTDKDGHYEFRLPPGLHHPYLMGQVPEGYLQPANQGKKDVTITEGETSEVLFEIQPDPAPIVEGTVVDPTGKPVPEAWITIENPNDRGLIPQSPRAKSDSEGHFRLHASPGYLLRAVANDLATKTPIQILDGGPLEIKLTKESKFTLVVQLTDPDGKPANKASAILITHRGASSRFDGSERQADAHGIVRFGPLPTDGKFSVQANGPDYGVLQSTVDMPTLDSEKNEVLLPLTLPAATAEIAGDVVDEDAKPLPNIAVSLSSSQAGQKETRTDAQGHFSFHVPEGATATVYPHRESGPNPPPFRTKAGETALNLILPNSTPPK